MTPSSGSSSLPWQTRFRLIETPDHRLCNNGPPMWRIVYTLHPRWISREYLRTLFTSNTNEMTRTYAIIVLREFMLCRAALYYLVDTRSDRIVLVWLMWRGRVICIYVDQNSPRGYASRYSLISIVVRICLRFREILYTFVSILWRFYARFCSITAPNHRVMLIVTLTFYSAF